MKEACPTVTLASPEEIEAALLAVSSDERAREYLYPIIVGWAGRTCTTEALVNYHLPTAFLAAYTASDCDLPLAENPDSQFDLISALVPDEVLRDDAVARRMALWSPPGPERD